MRRYVLGVVGVVVWCGCGGGGEEVAPQERCGGETRTFLSGELDADGAKPGLFELNATVARGSIQGRELVVRFASAELGEAMLVLRSSDVNGEFEELASRAVTSGPATFEVVNTSAGAADGARTSLAGFECALREGKVCVQVGLDSNGDGFLTDADRAVWNASGGEVVIKALANRASEVQVTWTLSLSANLVPDAPATRTGRLEGCLDGTYRQRAAGVFVIE